MGAATPERRRLGVLRPPATILLGDGVVDAVGKVAASFGRRVVVITDPYLAGAPQARAVEAPLRAAGLSCDVLDVSVAEVPLEALASAVERAAALRPDCIVALGGGSCIDTGKLVALALSTDEPFDALYGENLVPGPTLPLVAVPTTAGTGSEVTPVAVLSDARAALKVGISSAHLVPKAAICDPRLTHGAPAEVTAAAGIDALSHAIEAHTALRRTTWADMQARVFVGGNVLSDRFALHAVRRLSEALPRALDDDPAARAACLEGSLCAGLAFASAGTAGAHALQYPVGARTKTAHGVGVGVLLPYVMAYNAHAAPREMTEIALAMGRDAHPAAAIEGVFELLEALGLPRTLGELGVGADDLGPMAEQALGIERLVANNPREIDRSGALAILRAAWGGDPLPLSNPSEVLA